MQNIERFLPLAKKYEYGDLSLYDAAVDALLKAYPKLDPLKSEGEQRSFVKRAIRYAVNNQRRLNGGLAKPVKTEVEPTKRIGKKLHDFSGFYNAWLHEHNERDTARNRIIAGHEWQDIPWSKNRPHELSVDQEIGHLDGQPLTIGSRIADSRPNPEEQYRTVENIRRLVALPGVDPQLAGIFRSYLASTDVLPQDIQTKYQAVLLKLMTDPNWKNTYKIRDIARVASLIGADVDEVRRMPSSVAKRKLDRLEKLRIKKLLEGP